jgi:hypothetical protein
MPVEKVSRVPRKAAAVAAVPDENMTPQQVRDTALTAAYNAANGRLRDAHRDEFNSYYAEEAKKRGQEWEPKLTPEQKAQQQVTDLFAEFPALRERLFGGEEAEVVPEGEEVPEGDPAAVE